MVGPEKLDIKKGSEVWIFQGKVYFPPLLQEWNNPPNALLHEPYCCGIAVKEVGLGDLQPHSFNILYILSHFLRWLPQLLHGMWFESPVPGRN